MACTHNASCDLLPLLERERVLRLWQELYCERSHQRCMRFRLAQAGVTPAPELLPNGQILEAAAGGPDGRDEVTDSIDLGAALSSGSAR